MPGVDLRQRASRVAAGAAVAALLAACAATSGRPDVTGVVDVDSAGDLVVTQTGVSSYDGMRLAGTDPDVRDADDASINLDDLAEGDQVSVWVDAGCGESDPLSCDVLLVRVTG
jgi:hypothetical protein